VAKIRDNKPVQNKLSDYTMGISPLCSNAIDVIGEVLLIRVSSKCDNQVVSLSIGSFSHS